MARLTVSEQGEVTLRKEDLEYLGIQPGGELEVDLLPNGRLELHSVRLNRPPGLPIQSVFGILARKTTKVATLDEIQEATEKGWAGLLCE